MKLSRIAEALEAEFLAGLDQKDKEVEMAGAADLMSDVLAAVAQNGLLLTGLATVQVIKTALVADVSAVVFVRNKRPPQEAIDQAEQYGIPLLSTPRSMFVSCGRVYALGMKGLDGTR